jgi:hypothetical protein
MGLLSICAGCHSGELEGLAIACPAGFVAATNANRQPLVISVAAAFTDEAPHR